jgi:hypothetical protein
MILAMWPGQKALASLPDFQIGDDTLYQGTVDFFTGYL